MHYTFQKLHSTKINSYAFDLYLYIKQSQQKVPFMHKNLLWIFFQTKNKRRDFTGLNARTRHEYKKKRRKKNHYPYHNLKYTKWLETKIIIKKNPHNNSRISLHITFDRDDIPHTIKTIFFCTPHTIVILPPVCPVAPFIVANKIYWEFRNKNCYNVILCLFTINFVSPSLDTICLFRVFFFFFCSQCYIKTEYNFIPQYTHPCEYTYTYTTISSIIIYRFVYLNKIATIRAIAGNI